jgi:hypothetical protein
MPTASPAIALTDKEIILASRIDFNPSSDSHNPDAMEELMRSIMERGAIPLARRKYFTNPEYLIGGRGRSRRQVFEGNGTRGIEIFRHPNFVKYLRYFLYGPDLPQAVIEEFNGKVVDCGEPFTGSDALEVASFARELTRSRRLDKRKAPNEFYKLALDCGLDAWDARTVRDGVMKVR